MAHGVTGPFGSAVRLPGVPEPQPPQQINPTALAMLTEIRDLARRADAGVAADPEARRAMEGVPHPPCGVMLAGLATETDPAVVAQVVAVGCERLLALLGLESLEVFEAAARRPRPPVAAPGELPPAPVPASGVPGVRPAS